MIVKILSPEEFSKIQRSEYLYAPADQPEVMKQKRKEWEKQEFVKFIRANSIPEKFQWEQVDGCVYVENLNGLIDQEPYSKIKEIV